MGILSNSEILLGTWVKVKVKVTQPCPSLCNPMDYKGKKESEVAQSCPTLCDPIDCSPPGSSVHDILQTRILGWVAFPFPRGSSQRVSHIAGRFFTSWATREAGSLSLLQGIFLT